LAALLCDVACLAATGFNSCCFRFACAGCCFRFACAGCLHSLPRAATSTDAPAAAPAQTFLDGKAKPLTFKRAVEEAVADGSAVPAGAPSPAREGTDGL
jgi:hypothetical protein